MDRTLSGVTTPGQSGPRSNSNEGLAYVPQICKAGILPSDGFKVISRTLVCVCKREGVLHLCRDAVSVFYSQLTGLKKIVVSENGYIHINRGLIKPCVNIFSLFSSE